MYVQAKGMEILNKLLTFIFGFVGDCIVECGIYLVVMQDIMKLEALDLFHYDNLHQVNCIELKFNEDSSLVAVFHLRQ